MQVCTTLCNDIYIGLSAAVLYIPDNATCLCTLGKFLHMCKWYRQIHIQNFKVRMAMHDHLCHHLYWNFIFSLYIVASQCTLSCAGNTCTVHIESPCLSYIFCGEVHDT